MALARIQQYSRAAGAKLALPRAARVAVRTTLPRAVLAMPQLQFLPARCLSAIAPEIKAALNTPHPRNNVPESIKAKVGKKLLLQRGHPLSLIKNTIQQHFASGKCSLGAPFQCFDDLSPIVSVKGNFDDLLTPADHVSRQASDTFYTSDTHLLRCHMTAHQTELLRAGHRAFLMAGDVYRRDAVDATHYPIFHQIDGVRVFEPSELPAAAAASDRAAAVAFVIADLKASLESMVQALFGKVEMRWVEAYFPFTDPSLELEIHWEGQWLEVLGCGMIRQAILTNVGLQDRIGWAFGMGVERLAMVMYGVPDIRLFWTDDARFLQQFAGAVSPSGGVGKRVRFTPYSKHPACYKDVAFWLPGTTAAPAAQPFHENDFYALVRELAGDLCEKVERIDGFTNPKTGRTSHCYRILYRSMDKNLTNEEVDGIQAQVVARAAKDLGVTIR